MIFIFISGVVRVTDPHGSTYGPIASKDNVFTMGMRMCMYE